MNTPNPNSTILTTPLSTARAVRVVASAAFLLGCFCCWWRGSEKMRGGEGKSF